MQANIHNPEDISRSFIKKESTKEVEEKSNHQNHNEEHTQQQQVTISEGHSQSIPSAQKRGNQQLKK
jgi:hypothetical protein